MGALFAATVRAPLTGIVLVLEMTDNYQLILPMIITCLGATMLAQLLGGRPIYTVLLERILQRSEAKEKQRLPKSPYSFQILKYPRGDLTRVFFSPSIYYFYAQLMSQN